MMGLSMKIFNPAETMLKYLNLVTAHLVWAFNFLLTYPFFPRWQLIAFPAEVGHGEEEEEEEEELRICRYKNSAKPEGNNEEEATECAVCLCKIDEGEEMRELRCNHLFHRACLDRWRVGYGRITCPLCRDSLVPKRRITEVGMEVLLFKFCAFTSDDDGRETWWLR